MRRRRAAAVAIGVLVAVVAGADAAEPAADPSLATPCARCHYGPATAFLEYGGHGPGLECTECHPDGRGAFVGQNHRKTLDCVRCHDEVEHPERTGRKAARHPTRACLVCHDPHGTANARLVRPRVPTRTRNRRLRPVDFTDAGGLVAGGFASPDQPGTGLCEICHRKTAYYRADGTGEPHLAADCTQCHAHTEHFEAVVDDDNCTICHVTQGEEFAKPSGHHEAFAECSGCHPEVAAAPGPGHRAVPACTDCHDQATHAPAGIGPFACTDCHSPHGSDNIALVLALISTPSGAARPIRFDNLAGRADGSFASASAPGTGVCEICHTTTRFYRADGGGEPHLTTDCLSCHPHAEGFGPIATDATCTICHVEQGERFEKPSRHSETFTQCSGCHAEVSAPPGPGHRAVPACSSCHDQATHAPTGPGSDCSDCHEPHGTDNIELVLEQITIPSGTARLVRFDNRAGLADGSFASASAPGTGVCEICHTQTAYYRADGAGAPHFTLPCYPCHTHERGFLPPP